LEVRGERSEARGKRLRLRLRLRLLPRLLRDELKLIAGLVDRNA